MGNHSLSTPLPRNGHWERSSNTSFGALNVSKSIYFVPPEP